MNPEAQQEQKQGPKRSTSRQKREAAALLPLPIDNAPFPAKMPVQRATANTLPGATAARYQPLRIAVEGPLRVGKSTLARLLAERMGAARVTEREDNPFLARFYQGEPGMAFAAQMWFLQERMAQMQAASMLNGPVVSDYLLEKDKIFAHLTLSDAELAIYRDTFAAHSAAAAQPASAGHGVGLFRPELVVYLQANPAVLRERRKRKAHPAEQSIGEPYSEQVCEAYEHFFSRYSASRLLVVDTSAIDFVHNPRERELLLDRILAPVHGREHFSPLAQIA